MPRNESLGVGVAGSGPGQPVGRITALKRQDQPDEAVEILSKVYRYVIPLMKSRSWTVGHLSEFYPKNPRLLGINVNRGQRVNLRLRYPEDSRRFLPFESVLGTMLHELCHNRFGPHDQKFFKLLDELTEELEGLMAKGFTGDHWFGQGNKLGQSARPVEAIGSRITVGGLAGRGFRVGGTRKFGTPQSLAAAAAERRRLADQTCASQQSLEAIELLSDPESDTDQRVNLPGQVQESCPQPKSEPEIIDLCSPEMDVVDLC